MALHLIFHYRNYMKKNRLKSEEFYLLKSKCILNKSFVYFVTAVCKNNLGISIKLSFNNRYWSFKQNIASIQRTYTLYTRKQRVVYQSI